MWASGKPKGSRTQLASTVEINVHVGIAATPGQYWRYPISCCFIGQINKLKQKQNVGSCYKHVSKIDLVTSATLYGNALRASPDLGRIGWSVRPSGLWPAHRNG